MSSPRVSMSFLTKIPLGAPRGGGKFPPPRIISVYALVLVLCNFNLG